MSDPVSLPTPALPISYLNNQIESAKRSINASRKDASGQQDSKLQSACQEMESVFINYLLKEMRATIDKSGFMSESQAEKIYTSMLDAEMAKEAATRGGIGLAKLLLDQLSTEAEKKR
jgi:flagellar protein FlgJ